MTAADASSDLSGVFVRLRDGDPAARNELLDALYRRVVRLTAVLLRTFPAVQRRREVESVANDLSLKLIAALDAGLKTTSTTDFFRFAGTRLRHLLIDEAEKLRRRGVMRPLGGDGSTDGGANLDPGSWSLEPATLAQWTEFHQAVEGLPADQKAVFDMHFFLQMPQAEVARVLGKEPKQVSRLWLGACLRLADFLPPVD
jgi:RNA polymerase sigma-70 factor (ECF subfamily)